MQFENEKEPAECSGMGDIRAEIDRLDKAIITLIGKRFQYVQAAAKFKTSESSVRAPERFEAMLQQRRLWAQNQGLSPDVIEKLYTDLVNHFIEEEMKRWRSETPDA
ncbi:MAG: isochorismate lyase [Cyanobacteria bacterium P01_A01_bin.135]